MGLQAWGGLTVQAHCLSKHSQYSIHQPSLNYVLTHCDLLHNRPQMLSPKLTTILHLLQQFHAYILYMREVRVLVKSEWNGTSETNRTTLHSAF